MVMPSGKTLACTSKTRASAVHSETLAAYDHNSGGMMSPALPTAGIPLWEKFVMDPFQWWDKRWHKRTPDYGDMNCGPVCFMWPDSQQNAWIGRNLRTDGGSGFNLEGGHEEPRRLVGYDFDTEVGSQNELRAVAQLTQAVEALASVVESGCYVDDDVFYGVLKRCIAHKDLVLGSQVHCLAVESGYESNAFLANHFICMYASHGRLEEARQVFGNLTTPNQHVWSSIILAHGRNGQPVEAIKLYQQMRESTVKPDNHILVAVLKACASAKDLSFGKEVHADIVQTVNRPDMFVCNSLVDMYAKCGSLEDARRVFDDLPTRDVVTWTSMIAGYAQHGLGQEALDLYASMRQEGMTPANHVTFVCLLQACGSVGELQVGKHLHLQIQERGLEADLMVANCLVDMYSKCGSLKDARRVFDHLPTRDVVTWNAMIAGYGQHGLAQEALSLHASMLQEGIALENHVTFLCLLQACSRVGALHQGKRIHAQIKERGLEADVVVSNCLVDMYSKCGSLEDARQVFDNVPTRDVVTWNAMIAGYAQNGLGEEALLLYSLMQQEGSTRGNHVTFLCLLQACASIGALHEGKQLHGEIQERGLEADLTLGSCLVDMYSKCGSLEDARKVFDSLPQKNVVTWNAMMAGYSQHGLGHEALTLYGDMQQQKSFNIENQVTYVCLLQACASIKALAQGKLLHAQIQQRGLETDVVVGTSLVDMYVKCGSLDDAHSVFVDLPTKNVLTWTSMVIGYCQHGLGQEALALYGSMQQEGITPADSVMLICLLQACGMVASLEKGKEIHAQMSSLGLEKGGSDLSVANVLIDMYGKCGSLVDAQQVFDALATRDVMTWTALIGGYARQGESDHVFDLFDKMLVDGVQPDGITFLSVLTVCSHVGLVTEGLTLFAAMSRDYSIAPTVEHYNCMVDLLGRAGQLNKAMQMVKTMPCQPDKMVWRCMLGACQKWSNVELGRQAFEYAVRLNKDDAAAYVLMANIYAAAQMWEKAEEIQAMRTHAGAWKNPGQSWWTGIDGTVQTFVVGDRDHLQRQHVAAMLKDIFVKLGHNNILLL